MKISTSLLSAMLLGITLQATTSSCTKKDNDQVKPAKEQPSDVKQNEPPYECPACGMG